MITRLRVVLPPGWAILFVICIVGMVETPYLILEWQLGQRLDVVRPGLFVLRIIAFVYGSWRVAAFHPALLNEYRAWLERSPWTFLRPLPGGPLALAWEDALPLTALAIMARFEGPLAPVTVLGFFLAGYLLVITVQLKVTGVGWFGFAIALGLGLAVHFWPDAWRFLAALVASYAVAWVGIRASLARFPWPGFDPLVKLQKVGNIPEDSCGWPFDQLKPTGESSKFSRRDGILTGVLGGWYLYAAESLFPNPNDKLILVQLVFGTGVVVMAVVRTMTYCMGLVPPISLWGRIRLFRWIVPGYDQVFLAPICTLLVGVLAFDRFRPPGLDDRIFLPIAFGVAISVALTTGPSLERWKLTGQHRCVAVRSKMVPEYVKVG